MLVHTLACEAHLWFAIPCLESLLAFSEEPVRFVIHDDGSLTEGMTGTAKIAGKSYPMAWQGGRSAWRWLRSQVW